MLKQRLRMQHTVYFISDVLDLSPLVVVVVLECGEPFAGSFRPTSFRIAVLDSNKARRRVNEVEIFRLGTGLLDDD